MEEPKENDNLIESALQKDESELKKLGRSVMAYSTLTATSAAIVFSNESRDDWHIDLKSPSHFLSVGLLGYGMIGGYINSKRYLQLRSVVKYKQAMRRR